MSSGREGIFITSGGRETTRDISAEVVDQHGLGLFLAGLVEDDRPAVGRGPKPEGNSIEYVDGSRALARKIVKAQHCLMSQGWAYEENPVVDDLPARPTAGPA